MRCSATLCRSSRHTRQYGFLATLASMLLSTSIVLAQQVPPTSPPTSNAGASAAQAKIEPYPLNEATRAVLAIWQQQAGGRADLRIAIDERTAQALVFATPAVHAQIRQQIAQRVAAATASGNPASQTTAAANLPAGPAILQLRHVPAADLHPRLERVLGRALPATTDASGQWKIFTVEASPGAAVTMSVHTSSGQLRIEGVPAQVAAWRSVIEALDSPPSAGTVTQLVATKPASHDRVRRTLEALQARRSANQNATNTLVATLLQPQQDQQDADQDDAAPQAGAGQPPAQGEATTQVAPTDPQTAIDAARLAEAAGAILGPVDVEYVEGLDVIVLRGAERDVERVMEIIEQIEQLSAVTVPAIQIYNLQHVGSVQMGSLLNRLYSQVLATRLGGVSITPLGKPNALLLIGRAENVQMAIQMIQQLDLPVTPTARFEVFPLRHASAAEAKTLIDAFLRQDEDGEPQQDEETEEPITEVDALPPLAPRAVVVADIRTNALIVVASPRDLAEVGALLQRIDQPGQAAQLKVFTIRNGDATALTNMLRTLFAVPEDAAEGAVGGGIAQGGVVRMQFSVDQRTNSIIAVGSADDLIVVEAILTRLDEGDVRERVTTVYRLKNAFANDVFNALNLMLQSERTVETEAAVTISPTEQIEREVVVVPEPASNSLLVSATPRYYERIREIIEQLDERPPMVIIQVLIAEVRLNDTDEFGVELGLQDSVLFDRSLLGELTTITTTTDVQSNGNIVTTTQDTIVNAPGVPGFNFNDGSLPLGNNLSTQALRTASAVGAQGLSNFSTGRWNPALGFSGFVFSASSDAVSVLLRALQENRRLEVLSRPQLMALDGQQGEVQVGQNVPRIVQTNFDPLGGTINTIQYEPVGLILRVIPRISPDGLVVLQIMAIKSEVGNEVEGIPISISPGGQVLRAPRIEITQAITTVSALSGQTVVLGGLLQTRKFDVHRRVPIIADIPLIGDLFRYDSVAEERRELLIILTPRIIYGKEDSDLVKQIESSRMSWILGDVVALHGDAGLRSRCDEWHDADIEAVYPTYIPEEGILPLSEPRMVPFDGMTIREDCEPVILPGPMMIPADGAILAPPNGVPDVITVPPTTMPVTPGIEPAQDDPSQLPPPPLPPQTSILNDGPADRDQYGTENSIQQATATTPPAPAMLMMPTEAE